MADAEEVAARLPCPLVLVVPAAFPDATVWRHFGSGYGFVPLVLPVAALRWLHATRPVPVTDPHLTLGPR